MTGGRGVLIATGTVIGSLLATMGTRPGVLERFAWITLGVLAWWYLYYCATEQIRKLRSSSVAQDAESEAADEAATTRRATGGLVFVGVFYTSAGLLGGAWRSCRTIEPGLVLAHAGASSLIAATVTLVAWNSMARAEGGLRVFLAFLAVALAGVLLAWPSMAVWHVVMDSSGAECGLNGAPDWWPSWLPLG